MYFPKHNVKSLVLPFVFVLVFALLLSGCKSKNYNNFTTYFNTFYNEQKLMDQCEDEFAFQAEKKRTKPRVIIPIPDNAILTKTEGIAPAFLASFKVDKAARQAVTTKLDSILIKGSKILARSAKSDYIEPSLFLMAKAYFYKEEWIPSQIKCSELIDKNPVGKWSADGHLLFALNLLMQGKYEAGITMLSRTVDVAWLNNRYDILTKAFNIEAEMALYRGDLDEALRPYFQAIAQSDDNSLKAIWQNELASILFRMHKWDRAEKAYANVMKYSPDLVTEYESKLYRASCMIRTGRTTEAERILNRLDDDGKFADWKDYVMTQRLIHTYLIGSKEQIIQKEFLADSLFPTSSAKAAYYFEKGLNQFESGDYVGARSAISRVRTSVAQISIPGNKIFSFMVQREIYAKKIEDIFKRIEQFNSSPELSQNTDEGLLYPPVLESDTISSGVGSEVVSDPASKINIKSIDRLRIEAADNYFELARLHYNIGHKDSANYYYKQAADISPKTEAGSARYLYVYAESIRDTNEWKADSILNVIAETQPKTEYGQVALARLGYTAAFITDTAKQLYNSGYELLKYKEYDLAKVRLAQVFVTYPQNEIYAPKAMYALGYMYENKLSMPDSASYYYRMLIDRYPSSEYAKDLLLPTTYKGLLDSGGVIPDSLKTREVAIYKADTSIIHAPYDSTKLSKPADDSGYSFDDLKNPSKLLDKTKKKLQESMDKMKNAKEAVENPEEYLNQIKEEVQQYIKEQSEKNTPKSEDVVPVDEKKKENNNENNEPVPPQRKKSE